LLASYDQGVTLSTSRNDPSTTRALRESVRSLVRQLPLLLLLCALSSAAAAQRGAGPEAELPRDLVPAWAEARPSRIIEHHSDPRGGAVERGIQLALAALALKPGDMLKIGGGTYSIPKLFNLSLQGLPTAPIWIVPEHDQRVVITRPDNGQNVINLGGLGTPARYLIIQGIEVIGGSQGIRLIDADHIWIDRCSVHHTAQAGITANSADTSFLTFTRNEIHNTSGTGEGLYLGANNGVYVMSRSLIAYNWIHHTGGSQGDGIEVKQGSWGNRIVGNVVHDTNYPAILVYGTNGRARNVIERNVCFRSGDNVMQVQGEALVRNNLLVKGNIGFHTHDHQGKTRDLVVVHNTIITPGLGADLFSWNDRPGMVFANNAIYTRKGPAVVFENGSKGVQIAGNVVVGDVVVGDVVGALEGFAQGQGLTDFVNVDWKANALDARPTHGKPLAGAGHPAHAVSEDLRSDSRAEPVDTGCLVRARPGVGVKKRVPVKPR
jgi:hypothetical protein